MKINKFPVPGKIKIALCIAAAAALVSCNDFLDIVPDGTSELDHAFTNATEAEKVLFTCYSYMPLSGNPNGNIAFTAGDEMWLPPTHPHTPAPAWTYIANGLRNAENPLPNFWGGSDWTYPLYIAIRDCNMFLENVEDLSKVTDLSVDKRARWIAEVKFLKAYYHFFLLRLYGPIPIVDKNIPISDPPESGQLRRETFDDCVKYITELLDECLGDLPLVINRTRDEMGRITKPVNRALKAKVLLMAASPLFNGNPDYADFMDHEGVLLFNPEEDPGKWSLAADAAKEAIETAELAGHELFYFTDADSPFPVSETTKTQLSIRQSVCERWNKEIVWGLSGGGRGGAALQNTCMAILEAGMNKNAVRANLSPPIKIARQFYTKNGVPIEEDKTLDFTKINELRTATAIGDEQYNFKDKYVTARLNFDRENRFYASMGFDGGKWIMDYHISRSDIDTYYLEGKYGQLAAGEVEWAYSVTGYYSKKLVNWESGFGSTSTGVWEYAWPEIRLADIYLMYAEALNEAEGPVSDVHTYIDLVRKRAGLGTVANSWRDFSNNPTKPSTKEGMREIIQRERLNELALEGQRYWDLLRWKLAENYFNEAITGWDVKQKDSEAYYQVKVIYSQEFISPRDYLCPIKNKELLNNPELVQNPGWN